MERCSGVARAHGLLIGVHTNFTLIFCDKKSDKDLYDTGKAPFHPLRMNDNRSESVLLPDPLGKFAYNAPPAPDSLLNAGEGQRNMGANSGGSWGTRPSYF